MPEIIDKTMVNFIGKGDEKLPLACVFQCQLRTVIPCIGNLNEENEKLTRDIHHIKRKNYYKSEKIREMEDTQNNLDLVKDIEEIKAEKKELIRNNLEIGLKLTVKINSHDQLSKDLEESKQKNELDHEEISNQKRLHKDLAEKNDELEFIIKDQKAAFLKLKQEFNSSKEMIDKMVMNLSSMKDKIVAIKEENVFLKEKNNQLTLKNALGLEALTPRPDYYAIIADKNVSQYDDNISDYIKKPNLTSKNVVEYLFERNKELCVTVKKKEEEVMAYMARSEENEISQNFFENDDTFIEGKKTISQKKGGAIQSINAKKKESDFKKKTEKDSSGIASNKNQKRGSTVQKNQVLFITILTKIGIQWESFD